ncbi:MAG TPA: hypothetical protein VFX30_12035 [bacterium]|nr:hypothetical protein [bacterium]
MRLFRLSLAISLLTLLPLAAIAAEDEEAALIEEEAKISFAQEFDFGSQYVWRGFAQTRGPVLQPEASLSIYDLTLNLWANLVLNDEPHQGQFTEVDPSIDYYLHFGDLEIQPSFEYYFYPSQVDSPSTGELSLWLAYALGPVKLFTDHIFDVVRYGGAYFGDLGISHERDLCKKLGLRTSGAIGWASPKFNGTYGGISKAAFNVFLWDLELNYRPWKHFYVRPHMQVSVLLDPDLRSNASDPTILSGGLALGFTF